LTVTIVRWAASVFACLAIVASRGLADETWVDISSSQIDQLSRQPWPGGCAGVVVNRLSGDVLVNIVGWWDISRVLERKAGRATHRHHHFSSRPSAHCKP
jgi:hypothetical protein